MNGVEVCSIILDGRTSFQQPASAVEQRTGIDYLRAPRARECPKRPSRPCMGACAPCGEARESLISRGPPHCASAGGRRRSIEILESWRSAGRAPRGLNPPFACRARELLFCYEARRTSTQRARIPNVIRGPGRDESPRRDAAGPCINEARAVRCRAKETRKPGNRRLVDLLPALLGVARLPIR